MTQYGLLIDNQYCTGCHACEIACKNQNNLPVGQFGIKVLELGPWQLEDNIHWEYRYIPVPTSYCNLCEHRVADGDLPSCVFHCPANVMEYGPVEELAKSMVEKGKMASILIP